MLNRKFFKYLHILFTMGLILALAWILFSPPNTLKHDELIIQTQLDKRASLYITKYAGGGATVGEVYRYFIYAPTVDDPLKSLEKQAPFLVADNTQASIELNGNQLSVDFEGRIYNFLNQVFYKSREENVLIKININAQTGQASIN